MLCEQNVEILKTLRNKIKVNIEIIKNIFIYILIYKKLANNIHLKHYLIDLINGDGYFNSKQQLIIVFNLLNISLIYYLKKEIDYNSVHKVKVKNKNSIILVIAAIKDIKKIINLINDKLRSNNKFNQISKNILSHIKFKNFNYIITLNLNINNDLHNL